MKRAALAIVIVLSLGLYIAPLVHEVVTGPLVQALA